MQVDPIEPTLNAPGTKRLKLNYDTLLSSFAVNFNLRRYKEGSFAGASGRGRAVQVDPIKPTLKAPGTKRLKLNYDKLLSSFAFNSNLCCYTEAGTRATAVAATATVGPGSLL